MAVRSLVTIVRLLKLSKPFENPGFCF